MDEDAAHVTTLIRGAWATFVVRAACVLGLLDALETRQSLADLATRIAAQPSSLERLLRALVDLELVDGSPRDGYAATARGELLRTGHPSGLRDVLLMQTALPNLTAWQHLADAVRDDGPVYERLNGETLWQWLSRQPEEQARFDAAMARRAVLQADAVRAAIDLSEPLTLVDVGGGTGALVCALLASSPALTAVITERPDVAAAAGTRLAAAGFAHRARAEACDFFLAVPTGADLYVLSNVLHDWDDEPSTAILRTIRRAIAPHGRILILENVDDAPARSSYDARDLHLVDLHMLVMFGGRERTQAEYDTLLTAAGFTPSILAPSPNTWNALIATPAP